MGGYIGSSVGNVANAAERKQTYSITTATTSLTGLAYTPTKVHVFHNGVRLVDGTDYTATNGTSITLTNAAQNGDEVVVISYPSFQTSDTVSAANGGTFAGNVAFSGTTTGLDVNGTDLILDADGDSKIEASTDDTITVHTAGSEAMRIDSSGNVGIGTDSPSSFTNYTTATLGGGSSGSNLDFHNSSGTRVAAIVSNPSSELILETTEATPFILKTNSAERMRLDTSENLLIGKTTSSFSADGLVLSGTGNSSFVKTSDTVIFCNRLGTDGHIIKFYKAGTEVGSVGVNSSTTFYNTSSDHRLKENVGTLSDGITRVKQLKPKRFSWIIDEADSANVDGFLAHEAQTVVPEAVTGTKDEVDDNGDAVMQGIDQSKLVPLLTAALQEAIAKIETLETKVAALEAG